MEGEGRDIEDMKHNAGAKSHLTHLYSTYALVLIVYVKVYTSICHIYEEVMYLSRGNYTTIHNKPFTNSKSHFICH